MVPGFFLVFANDRFCQILTDFFRFNMGDRWVTTPKWVTKWVTTQHVYQPNIFVLAVNFVLLCITGR